jgi:glucan 1,3-beta-glucosidase
MTLAAGRRVQKGTMNFAETMEHGVFGFCFSAYEDGQEPGTQLSEAQVRRRMEILQPHTQWIRSFSCVDGNELIPQVAKEMGINTLVGAWLGHDHEKNESEIQRLIELAHAGYVDIAAVGNEVLYREELSEEELIGYIRRVKEALPGIPVGYVDAYYEFENRPAITEACDVILTNCYPFWEGCAHEYSILYMKDMYRRSVRAAQGKPVIITETGWPSEGGAFHGAVPGHEQAKQYFLDTQQWSREEGIEIFYFSTFDESWKVGNEGDVGAYWGIWDKDEKPKFGKTKTAKANDEVGLARDMGMRHASPQPVLN